MLQSKKLAEASKQELARLYCREGKSLRELAAVFRCCIWSVRSRLTHFRIPIAKPGRRPQKVKREPCRPVKSAERTVRVRRNQIHKYRLFTTQRCAA